MLKTDGERVIIMLGISISEFAALSQRYHFASASIFESSLVAVPLQTWH